MFDMQVVANTAGTKIPIPFRILHAGGTGSLVPFFLRPRVPVLDAVVIQVHSISFNLVAVASQEMRYGLGELIGADNCNA